MKDQCSVFDYIDIPKSCFVQNILIPAVKDGKKIIMFDFESSIDLTYLRDVAIKLGADIKEEAYV